MARRNNNTATNRGAYVRIQSTTTISVTMGLQNQDVTNADAHVPDRLKVNPLWPKLSVLIVEGVHWYPSEIADWATVKSLVDDKIITIGEYSDTCDEEGVEAAKQKLDGNIDNVEKRLQPETAPEQPKAPETPDTADVAPSLDSLTEE